MMLIHKICMAFRGLGSFRNVDIVIREIAAILLYMENRKYQSSEIKVCSSIEKKVKALSRWTWHNYCMYVCVYVYVIGPSPLGLWRTNETNDDE